MVDERTYKAEEEIKLSSHKKFLLENSEYLFWIEEGEADLLFLATNNESSLSSTDLNKLEGSFTFIQSLKTHSLIFPFPANPAIKSHLILRTNGKAVLKKIKRENIDLNVIANDLSKWITFFSFLYPNQPFNQKIQHQPVDTQLQLEKDTLISVEADNLDNSHLLGLILSKGELNLFNKESLPLKGDNSCIYPFHPTLWFLPTTDKVEFLITHVIDPRVWKGLDLFHEHILTLHHEFKEKERTRHIEMGRLSDEYSKETLVQSFNQLKSVLEDKTTFFPTVGPSLLYKACVIVGNEQDISFSPPPKIDVSKTYNDQIMKICFHSNVYYREIKLREGWWRHNWGAFVGFYGSENKPVALVPNGDNRYKIIDPEDKSVKLVDKAVDDMLNIIGFVFYRPFPSKTPLTGKDILNFSTFKKGAYFTKILFLGLLGTLFSLFYPFANKIIYSYVIPNSDFNVLFQLSFALLIVLLVSSLFNFFKQWVSASLNGYVAHDLQFAVWQRLFDLPMKFFKSLEVGDLIIRAFAFEKIRQQLGGAGIRIIINAFFALTLLFPMFYFSPYLTFVSFLLLIPLAIYTAFVLIRNFKTSADVVLLQQQANSRIIQFLTGISKIRNAGAEYLSFVLWEKIFYQIKKKQWSLQRITNQSKVLNFLLGEQGDLILYAAILISLNEYGSNEGLNLGNFLAFLSVGLSFRLSMLDFSNILLENYNLIALWKNSEVILKEPLEIDKNKSYVSLNGEVRVDHLFFRYSKDDPLIVNDLSFYANPGEFVAIVGPSGGGKSTIVRLLIGFEEPESGAVYYDGKDLSTLNLRHLRKQIGALLQSSNILEGTLRDNITAGENYTDEEINNALTLAGFKDYLKTLTMGLHTPMSNGGQSISGGQKQRIMIARAIIAKPKIFIFDESTSALDNISQEIVNQNLLSLNVTRIVLAHRLSTIKQANRIYVIDKGRVVETGTFSQLLDKNGFFAQMVNKQKFSIS